MRSERYAFIRFLPFVPFLRSATTFAALRVNRSFRVYDALGLGFGLAFVDI